MKNKVTFQKWSCFIQKEMYKNNRTALCLIDCVTGEEILYASVNVPELALKQDEIIIKNYSENEGILPVLVAAKIISEPLRFHFAGFPICKLLI